MAARGSCWRPRLWPRFAVTSGAAPLVAAGRAACSLPQSHASPWFPTGDNRKFLLQFQFFGHTGVATGESRTAAQGSSAMAVDTRKAFVVGLTIAEGMSRSSPITSSVKRSPRRSRGDVMPLPSRSPTFVDGGASAMTTWSLVPWELARDVDAQT